jgi:glucokinase
MSVAIGIDVGGTNLRVGVFDDLTLMEETRFRADFSGFCKDNAPEIAWQKILDCLQESIHSVLSRFPKTQAIGIGFPGFIDPKTGNIVQSPNLPGLVNVNLARDLSSLLGKKVVVENDANAAAFGEFCVLKQKDANNVEGLIYLGLGTGVGGGLVFNDVPFVGQHGCAMEAGHIIVEPNGRLCGCGNHGCLEQYASASGVTKSYLATTGQHFSADKIASLANEGDENAVQAYVLAAEKLAQALASILKVVDVSHIVIGGGMVAAWHLMQTSFFARLHQDLIPVLREKITVNISTTHDIAGMLGAARMACRT